MGRISRIGARPALAILLLTGGFLLRCPMAARAQDSGDPPAAVKVAPSGTADDPENLAQNGYTPREIWLMHEGRKREARQEEAKAKATKGDWDGAITIYNELLAFYHGDDERSRLGLAEAYEGKRDVLRALDCYRRAIYRQYNEGNATTGESNPRVLMQFALLLLKTRRYDEAYAAYGQAMRFFIDDRYGPPLKELVPQQRSEALHELPFIAHLITTSECLAANDLPSAVAHAREAVRLRPAEAIGHLYLSQALQGYFEGTREQKLAVIEEARKEMAIAARTGTGAVKEYAQRMLEAHGWTAGAP